MFLSKALKHFGHYCLQAFSAAEIVKYCANHCFEINGQQVIKMPERGEYVRFKNYERILNHHL